MHTSATVHGQKADDQVETNLLLKALVNILGKTKPNGAIPLADIAVMPERRAHSVR